MKRETISLALGMISQRHVTECMTFDPGRVSSPERIERMKTKRLISVALAAALVLALGAAAYAVWSVHAARQQELREDLQIDDNHVDSYVEYAVPEGQDAGLVVLSAVNDGQEERVYVNISPVSEAEVAAFPNDTRFVWTIEGTQIGGFAAPQLPSELNLSGAEEIRAAVLEHAYDKDTKTLTLQCWLDVERVRQAMAELGTDSVPLSVRMGVGDAAERSFGPIDFTLTPEQRRVFDFGGTVYRDEELGKEIELLSLELTPFSAVWRVRYDGAEAFHQSGADWDAYHDWSIMEDRVCIESELIFADGSSFSTGGAVSTPYEDGAVNLICGWGSSIDIDDVQRIVLGDLVLWEAG